MPNPFLAKLTDREREWLKDHPVVTVAQDPDWAPIEFADADGNPTGISEDYLRLVEERLGIQFKRFRNLSWQESYVRLKRWDIDMTTSVTPTSEREKFWLFTKPYLKIPIVLIALKDVSYVANMHDLAGKKIGVVDGYVIADWLERDNPEIQVVRVKNVEEGLDLVQRNVLFGYADNMLVSSYYLTKLKMANLKIAGATPYQNRSCMAVRKDWSIFAGILQKALDSIPKSEHEAIYTKWVPIRFEHGYDYGWLWRLLTAFVIILLLMALWNWRMSREIKQRIAAEAALHRSREQVRLALQAANQGFYDLNVQTGETEISPEYATMLGYDPATFRETNNAWIERIHPDDRDSVVSVYNDYVAGKIPEYRVEFRQRKKSGDWRWILSLGKIVETDSQKRPLRMLGTHTDITDRKEAEEQRRILQMQLLQSQKLESLGRLAGGVAHDINNMLAAILGHAELAMMRCSNSNPIYADLSTIEKAAQRSADLVRQLLAFARKQTVAPRIVDLNECVSGTLKMLRRLIGEDIDVAWLPGEELWSVKIDPSQIDQVLANLCVNARDAIKGVGRVTIETSNATFDEAYCAVHPGYLPGKYVTLAVSDDGSGMDKEEQNHIFEPFYTTKETGKGTGLGLSTVYGIVKQNNGFINVYSEMGKGSTFKIYLPRQAGDAAVAVEATDASMANGNGEVVLLVEDESIILDISKAMLEKLGYSVLSAGTPREAIEIFTANVDRVELLVTDVIMPEMNGKDLATTLCQIKPSLKCLFTSGYTANVIAHRGVLEESVHFIQKPFTLTDLARMVRVALDR